MSYCIVIIRKSIGYIFFRQNVSSTQYLCAFMCHILIFTILLNIQQANASSMQDGGGGLACPSQDYNEFLDAFKKSTNIQKAFTRFPLEFLSIADVKPHPMPVLKLLKNDDIKFPIIKPGDDIWVDMMDVEPSSLKSLSRLEISVDNGFPDGKVISYFFVKDSCFKLVRIEDWTWPKSMKSAWLMNIFPRLNACTPRASFYDDMKHESNKRFMENRGYSSYEINHYAAKYKINEVFFGLKASGLDIAAHDSFFAVTVESNVDVLLKEISQITGYVPKVHLAGEEVGIRSGSAYLVSLNKNQSMFVCYTYEE